MTPPPTHFSWPDIGSFHNIRKTVSKCPDILENGDALSYLAKVKLDGTNAAVQVFPDGKIVCQSRNEIITPEKDNCGFARWVDQNKEAWSSTATDKHFVVYGEWCGPGVQKGVAISQIPTKSFVTFSVFYPELNEFVFDPDAIAKFLPKISDVYVLPWYDLNVEINWFASSEELQSIVDRINEVVHEVEKSDPWVKSVFDIDGIGEGLVFYPVSKTYRKDFSNLVFKAKGEKHKTVKQKTPVQVNPEIAESAKHYADLVLTEARLEQGARAISNQELVFDIKKIGQFIGWINKDLLKETQDELAASGLEWKAVQGEVSSRARNWYLYNCKKL